MAHHRRVPGADPPALSVAVVTGGNTGIGKETAAGLAALGAEVIITARDMSKGDAAVKELRERGHDRVSVVPLDLASFASIHQCANSLPERIDVLVNNAGLALTHRQATDEGFEMTFGVNHLGHFLLTTLLLERIRSRVVTVSSVGPWFAFGGMRWDDLQMEHRYKPWEAYSQSKLANILFTRELARRLSGTGITANACHPGSIRSNFGMDGDTSGFLRGLLHVARRFQHGPEWGARTSIHLASSPAVEGVTGESFVRCKRARSSRHTRAPEAARRLWEVSEHLVAAGGPA